MALEYLRSAVGRLTDRRPESGVRGSSGRGPDSQVDTSGSRFNSSYPSVTSAVPTLDVRDILRAHRNQLFTNKGMVVALSKRVGELVLPGVSRSAVVALAVQLDAAKNGSDDEIASAVEALVLWLDRQGILLLDI